MKKLPIFLIATLSFFLFTQSVFASEFSSSFLKLDRIKASSPLSGTVCAKPSTSGAGTEAKIIVTFPSDFTISGTTSNWTTNTNNLPNGATAWPSISDTATNISGKSVTFTSGDLTSSSSLYCFNFTGSSSTTGASGNDKNGSIVTQNNSGTTINSTEYGISITSNDQITVTASVAPSASDLPISIISLTSGTNFPQNTEITYQITYGNNASVSLPIKIQTEWSLGTIKGQITPTVELLDYVANSATEAYGSTPAVIDTINRTITWTISSFPAETVNKTVTFKLKTNSSYAGSSVVSFSVAARATSLSTVTPDSEVSQTYLYNATPTPTPTPKPTATPTPTPTPATPTPTPSTTTPTPTPTPTPALSFTEIPIRTISSSDATIYISTTKDATFTVQYGESLNNLSSAIKSLTLAKGLLVEMPDLEPDTEYYFKVTARDATGNIIKSDIYIFKTAAVSTAPQIDNQTLVITSQNNVLFSPKPEIGKAQPKAVIIPQSTVFEIRFALKKIVDVKSVEAIVRNKMVLGISNFIQKAEASNNFVNLVEIQPGIFTGKMASFSTPGIYELYIRIQDYKGNISEQKLAEVKVARKMTVLDKDSKKPIEAIKATIQVYNENQRIYRMISPSVMPIDNPTYSQLNGTFNLVLPPGKYQVTFSSLNYKDKTIEFVIGESGNEDYPLTYLEKTPFNIINAIKYYYSSVLEIAQIAHAFIVENTKSQKYFEAFVTFNIISLIFITILSFSVKTHVPLLSLSKYFSFHLKYFLKRKVPQDYIYGQVIDEDTKRPVSKAQVYVLNRTSNKIIESLTTDKMGDFYFKNSKINNFTLSVIKKDYIPNEGIEYNTEILNSLHLTITVRKDETLEESTVEKIGWFVQNLFGFLFEFLLFSSMIIELFFIPALGYNYTHVIVIVSIFNLILWFFYLRRARLVKIT